MMEGGDLFNRIHSKKQAAWEGFKAQWRRLIVRTDGSSVLIFSKILVLGLCWFQAVFALLMTEQPGADRFQKKVVPF